MPSRRQILEIGVAAGAWSVAAGVARAAATAAPAPHRASLPLYKVIVDTRHEHSVRFGDYARAQGLAIAPIEGDMTRVWYDDIYHAWRSRPVAIAGLTEHGALFCFEQLARDSAMRVVFRASHALTPGGALAHALSGPASMLDACDRLADAHTHWPEIMAAAVARCPVGSTALHARTITAPQSAALGTGGLHTWVIAPVVRSTAHSRRVERGGASA